MWATELRRADERAERFKADIETLRCESRELRYENDQLLSKLEARDREINRLHSQYRGGQSFQNIKDAVNVEEQLQKAEELNGFFQQQLLEISSQINLPSFKRSPNDRSNAPYLPEMVRKLKDNLEDLREDNQELERVIENLKSGDYI